MAETVLAKMAVQIAANTAEFGKGLNDASNTLKGFSNNVKSLGSAIGLSLGGAALFGGIKAGIGIIADFEKRMSEVKAITGATGKEFDDLKNNALELGRATLYSAEQVAELQVAYGRLGFTTKEIIAATEATINLATATGENLAKSADIVGSTIRAFGLSADETTRVTDVMASSFNKTALGLDNFGEAMKYVAPVAAQAGISLEETTALLGTLADAGIRGSSAGTSLRKIISDLGGETGTLSERLKKLAEKGLTGAQAMDEVGRTAYASLLVLSKATAKTDDLAAAFSNAAGETAKMAAIMSDNFAGDVVKLTGAFEGLLLKLGGTDTVRFFTQSLTDLFSLFSGGSQGNITAANLFFKSIADDIADGDKVSDLAIKKLKELRAEIGKPLDSTYIEKLILDYQLTEKQALQLKSVFNEVNRSLSEQEKIIQLFNEFSTRNGYTDLSKSAHDYIDSIYKLISAEQDAIDRNKDAAAGTSIFDKDIEKSNLAIAGYKRVITSIEDYVKSKNAAVAAQPSSEGGGSTPRLGLIPELEAQIKSLKEAQRESFSVDQINDYQRQIETLTERLKLLTTLTGEMYFDPHAFESDEIKTFNEEVEKTRDYSSQTSEQLNKMQEAAYLVGMSFQEAKEPLDAFSTSAKKMIIDIGPLVAGFISDMASALGELAVGTGDLGQSLLKAIGKFAVQFGELLIASAVGTIALQSGNPYAMLAGGAILVAAGAALSALSKQRQNISGSSAPSAVRSNNSSSGDIGSNGFEIEVGGEFRIKGQDLVYIINRQNQLSSRTTG